VNKSVTSYKTNHLLVHGDARDLSFIKNNSVHLVITSPPYWKLKRYNDIPNQMGHIIDYEEFLTELNKVLSEINRILTPGGRLVCVVGDVCLSRKENGRHLVMPLHADIQVLCRKVGLDNLNPIIWHKISNAKFEANTSAKFLGKPYEPNAIIKNDIEFILMQRKPGGYRQPSLLQRKLSMLSKEQFDKWFSQIWNITGESTRQHPAPFPLELAERIVKMFSFVGDTVLDPFCGSGTSMLAAMNSGRHSIGVELDSKYCTMIEKRFETIDLFQTASFRKVSSKKDIYTQIDQFNNEIQSDNQFMNEYPASSFLASAGKRKRLK
jgi:modification methylase